MFTRPEEHLGSMILVRWVIMAFTFSTTALISNSLFTTSFLNRKKFTKLLWCTRGSNIGIYLIPMFGLNSIPAVFYKDCYGIKYELMEVVISPSKETKPNYIISSIRKETFWMFPQLRVMRGAVFGTGHILVRAKLRHRIMHEIRYWGIKVLNHIDVSKLKESKVYKNLQKGIGGVEFDWRLGK